jgi:hypothetical protein
VALICQRWLYHDRRLLDHPSWRRAARPAGAPEDPEGGSRPTKTPGTILKRTRFGEGPRFPGLSRRPPARRDHPWIAGSSVDHAESTQELTHTLVLSTGGGDADLFAVSVHESAVWEVRLSGAGLTPAEAVSFGSVKALYR